MKKVTLILVLLLASAFRLPAPAFGTTVTGKVSDSSGAAVAGAAVSFRLINIGRGNVARVTGTSIVAPTLLSASSAADGTFTATITGNDAITPAGTLYEVVIRGPGFTYGPFDYSITGSAADLNSLTPEATFPNTSSQVAASQLSPPSGCASNQVLQWTGTVWTCATAGSGSGAQHEVNGTNVTINSTINFENSAPANGLTLTFANPSAGNVQLGLSGTLTDAGLASSYSGTGSCAAHQWIFSLTRNGAPTCTQPAYSDITGTPTLPQNAPGIAHQFLTAYNSTTGAFTLAQPAYGDISGTPALFNQTIEANGIAQTQRPAINFSTNFLVADNAVSNRTDLDLASTINSNTSGNAATATALASAPTQCTSGQFATGVAASGNANCGTPAATPPGGTSGQVQYNNAGAFGGISQNAFDSTRNVIQLSPNCVAGETNCFQVKDDGFMATDCSVTSGSAVVTCTGSRFTAAMADGLHHIAVFKTCSTDAGLGNYVTELGATGATISTFTSGTSVTASANATGTVTNTACMVVASLDDTPISAADAAAQASPTCPLIELPAGIMGTKEPHFFTLPASCSIDGRVTGESAYAPMFVIEGQGGGVSTLWWTPDFDFAACTHGSGLHACMMDDFTLFRNWGITGGGLPSFTGTVYLISNDIGGHVTSYLDGFQCVNIGPNSASPTSQIGHFIGNDVLYTNETLFDGCGAAAIYDNAKLITWRSAFQDSGQAEIHIGGFSKLTSLGGNFFYGASGMGSFKNLIEGGVVTTAPGDDFKTNFGPATLRCWQSTSNSGQSFYMNGAFCDAGQGIVVQNTGATITLRDSQLTSTTPLIVSSGAPVIADYGNNTLGGAPSGTFTVTRSESILGAQAATNITPSTGWGTTGAAGNGVSAASGTSLSERFTITAAGTPTANPTVAITFPVAFWAAPQCTAQQIGGTGAIQALTTGATESTTGVTLTWHGTAVAASTYIIQVNCR